MAEQDRVRHVIGCMTGTSLDGLDAALVRITGTGLEMKAEFVGMVSHSLGELADTLRSMAGGNAHPPIDFLRAARKLGELHAAACVELCEKHGTFAPSPPVRGGSGQGEGGASASHGALGGSTTTTDPHPNPLPKREREQHTLDFVVAHGQTIWHAPRDERGHMSWQLFDPWPIVRRLGVPVCYDLRQADLIAGGEGAPITPIADWVMYRSPNHGRLIVNLGGICNITRNVGKNTPITMTGADVGPCNLLIDGVVRELFPDLTFDRDGAIAARGQRNSAVADAVFEHPFFQGEGRSTGREDFSAAWVRSIVERLRPTMTPEDIVSGAVDAVVRIIYTAAFPGATEAVLAGGGARNKTLVSRLGRGDVASRVTLSDDLGIPIDAREAMGFAVLGALSQDGVPITLPRVTRSENPGRAGAWVYP